MLPSLLLPLCLGFWVLPAACDDPPADGKPSKVSITLIVILGTDQNTKVDPKLECIAREVRKQDDKLTGFRIATSTCKDVAVGDTKTFPVIGEQEARVEVKQCCEDAKRICLKVKAPKFGGVTYTSVCGKYLPLLTGLYNENGERVILAVMVNPCKDEEE